MEDLVNNFDMNNVLKGTSNGKKQDTDDKVLCSMNNDNFRDNAYVNKSPIFAINLAEKIQPSIKKTDKQNQFKDDDTNQKNNQNESHQKNIETNQKTYEVQNQFIKNKQKFENEKNSRQGHFLVNAKNKKDRNVFDGGSDDMDMHSNNSDECEKNKRNFVSLNEQNGVSAHYTSSFILDIPSKEKNKESRTIKINKFSSEKIHEKLNSSKMRSQSCNMPNLLKSVKNICFSHNQVPDEEEFFWDLEQGSVTEEEWSENVVPHDYESFPNTKETPQNTSDVNSIRNFTPDIENKAPLSTIEEAKVLGKKQMDMNNSYYYKGVFKEMNHMSKISSFKIPIDDQDFSKSDSIRVENVNEENSNILVQDILKLNNEIPDELQKQKAYKKSFYLNDVTNQQK